MEVQTIVIGENTYIPRYSQPDSRSRYRNAVEYDNKGKIQSIYLESISKIKTPVGAMYAEFVTFYPSGHIHRVFASFGKISGFWSEEEEKELLEDTTLLIKSKTYSGKFSCVCFYETGEVKSITIWPGEVLKIKKLSNIIKVRYGISFYRAGEVKSLEPAVPSIIHHETGSYLAYNPFALGVTGDNNSLCFDEQGKVNKLTSNITGVKCISKKDNSSSIQGARLKPSPFDLTEEVLIPITIEFTNKGIILIDSDKCIHEYGYKEYDFETVLLKENLPYMTCGDCSSCNKCNKGSY